jgi:hypothetical protein
VLGRVLEASAWIVKRDKLAETTYPGA